jgi:CRP-like cAMP-binding protein
MERLLAQIPLLAGLEPAERRLFRELVRTRSCKPRETVVWEGQDGGALFLVLSGFLKAVAAGTDGQNVVLSIMGPTEVFGELSILDGEPRSASVICLDTPAELATIEREPFLHLLEGSPKLAIRLLGVLSQRLRNLTKRCENVSCLEVRGRLARAILGLAEKHGRAVGAHVELPMKLSQQDLGNLVGASRESVNKELREWTQQGVLRHASGRLTITDQGGLRSLLM